MVVEVLKFPRLALRMGRWKWRTTRHRVRRSTPLDLRAGGDSKDMELHTSLARDNDSIVWDPKPCNCVADGPKCRECLASERSAVKVQLESWSVEKTVIFGVILGAFFIWAVVFGICLNVFKL
ncbi:hypothetical protein MTO96_023755 [Rhipicephalus appendiculatus]